MRRNVTMDRLVDKYVELNQAKKLIDDELQDVKQQIISEMNSRGKDECKFNNHTCKIVCVTSKVFNSKKFKTFEPDMYNKFVEDKNSQRFYVLV